MLLFLWFHTYKLGGLTECFGQACFGGFIASANINVDRGQSCLVPLNNL